MSPATCPPCLRSKQARRRPLRRFLSWADGVPGSSSLHTFIADGPELVARHPVRHLGGVRRFPSQPEPELRHLPRLRPVPLRVELVARLVVAMLAVVLRRLLSPAGRLADDVDAGIDRHRWD